MSEYKDLQEMLEIIITAIEIHGCEEEFFRRSARASTSEVAKSLLSEIADDLAKHRESLEARKQKLLGTLTDLQERNRRKRAQTGG